MKHPIIFSLIFCGLNALASQQEIDVKEGSHLLISCEEATVTLVGGPQAKLKIVLDPVGESLVEFASSNDGNSDYFQIRDKASRPKMKQTGKHDDSKNHVRIEISGRSLPAEIHLREGQVTLQKWQKEVYAHVQKGKIIAKENSNSLVLHMQKGEIAVTDHQGKLLIDSLQASAMIKELKGDLEAQSFMGDLTLEKFSGSGAINANQGSVKVVGGSGSLQFELQKANLQSTQFDGRVEGQSQEGSVAIQAGKDPDVNIKSQTGKVSVSTTANSGALLNLSSAEGDVIVPAYLKVSRDGSVRSLRGRLKGESQKGSIFVRSQEGVITVR